MRFLRRQLDTSEQSTQLHPGRIVGGPSSHAGQDGGFQHGRRRIARLPHHRMDPANLDVTAISARTKSGNAGTRRQCQRAVDQSDDVCNRNGDWLAGETNRSDDNMTTIAIVGTGFSAAV
jgi:hypothetical protein